MNRIDAEKLIWKACDELLRDSLPTNQALEVVMDVLLWARWIPASEGEFIGYFDAMQSLSKEEQWEALQAVIAERSGKMLAPSLGVARISPKSIEKLRATLLPIGRALNCGDPLQCKVVIEALSELLVSNRSGGELGCSASMGSFWEALLTFHPGEIVACLFPLGVAAAPFVALDHALLFSSANSWQTSWIQGLLSLYPQEVKRKSLTDQEKWSVAIAVPPWGEKTRQLLSNDPWLPPSPLECPSAIKNNEARRVFAAHQRCSGTTYALISPGIAFRSSKDLEYFREELVRKNWLDAVITMPAGVHASASIEGLLLVLKQDRTLSDPILMVAAQDLLSSRKSKSQKQAWDLDGIKNLTQLLHQRRDSACSRLVTARELEANGFSFQVSRYLHSENDRVLQQYLDSRKTVHLGDLAEIRRPVASLGHQDEEGIEVREVTPGDIDDSGQLHQGSKRIQLPEAVLAKARQQLLEPGDVLLSIKGGLGKVAMVQDLKHPTIPGQAFCVARLRPNAPLTPAALVQYLRSAVGQTLLDKVSQATPVAFVPMGEVKSLPIVIPSAAELKRAEELQQESLDLSREVANLNCRLTERSRIGWLQDLPPQFTTSSEEDLA
jgi:hypothetical protein